MKTWVILLAIYLISATVSYFELRWAYRDDRMWSMLKPGWGDIGMIFTPILNTFFMFMFVFYISQEIDGGDIKFIHRFLGKK